MMTAKMCMDEGIWSTLERHVDVLHCWGKQICTLGDAGQAPPYDIN